jgi:hypothetical protein
MVLFCTYPPQLNVGDVDPETGLFTKTSATFALSGAIRAQSEGDNALNFLVKKHDAEKH